MNFNLSFNIYYLLKFLRSSAGNKPLNNETNIRWWLLSKIVSEFLAISVVIKQKFYSSDKLILVIIHLNADAPKVLMNSD